MTPDLALSIRSLPESPRPQARPAIPGEAERVAVAPPAPVTPNPRLRLDAPLGMVVIEFRDAVGEVANTIPSPRQMAAYRAAAVSDAPVPVGVPTRSAPAPAAPAAPELPPLPAEVANG